MLTIRLQRVGRKNDPSFRVILVESKRAAKTGNFQELLGSYDPRSDRIDLKAERIKHWIGMGATVSDTMHNLLISEKVIEGKKINILPSFAKTMEGKAAQEPAVAALAEAPAAAPESASEAKGDNAVAEEPATS
ncbi:MAG: 30S ribosomal protein S16 [Patescibacteria group bacterium]|nr:30S ribosomal protein S16 [Patescibacteria group bacterium]